MGRFDKSIEWLETQMANAAEALRDLRGGLKIEINNKDVTGWWVEKHEQIVAQCKELIAAYKKRND